MITLSIRYTIDARKRQDFEQYARALGPIIPRCGGELVGYWLPTKFAGPTNAALALIDFPSLAAYEQYRERLAKDPDNVEASSAPRRAAASSSRTGRSWSASSSSPRFPGPGSARPLTRRAPATDHRASGQVRLMAMCRWLCLHDPRGAPPQHDGAGSPAWARPALPVDDGP